MASKLKNIPKYHGLRIFLIATILYFFLVMPIVGILFIKYAPDYWKQNFDNTNKPSTIYVPESLKYSIRKTLPELEGSLNLDSLVYSPQPKSHTRSSYIRSNQRAQKASKKIEITQSETKFSETIIILFKLILLSLLIGFAFNYPFKLYFIKKRKNKKIPERLFRYCKKFLIKTPFYNSMILLGAYGASIIYMTYLLFLTDSFDENTRPFFAQYYFISVLATILTVVFVFYWQKHRVQLKYIEHVFSPAELRKRIYKIKVEKIKNRMWISSGMTTLLPLIIVVFYLLLSVTSIDDIGLTKLTDSDRTILFGKYAPIFSSYETSGYQGALFYVNAFDSLLMYLGIFTSIFTSFIYILVFIRWTTQDIVGPVKELLNNMQLTGQGELDQYSIVRTNDEIGELAEGFNEMSDKLKEYILNISRINQANSRFVPRQFIEFLGKDNIADISLGDQVQKEMTILFSDIRGFTSISENMTPKENFDFLNNYLGHMEPVIRTNKGFIDKFMGDSIMALFSDTPEDAINAAIEMRLKLQEFNHINSQFGKAPIDSGIGLHTGNLMLGIVGGEGRMDGTVISDAVNLASRLEGLTKLYGSSIIISEDTLIKLSDPSKYDYRFIDIVKVKGKKEAVYIFEILNGEPAEIKALKLQTKAEFSKALQLYKNKEFKKALPIFKEIHKLNKKDKAAQMYLLRCSGFIENGTSVNWDGIEVIQDK
jgi:class 3 adenylate cyclase